MKFNKVRELIIFDFDETLLYTNSRVIVTHENGKMLHLSPSEYAKYKPLQKDVFDYNEFQDLGKDNERVIGVTEFFKNRFTPYLKSGKNIIILTARQSKQPMIDFFYDYLNILSEENTEYKFTKNQKRNIIFIPLGNSDPNEKKEFISNSIKKYKLDLIEFYDDSDINIEAVEELKLEFPLVKIKTKLIKY